MADDSSKHSMGVGVLDASEETATRKRSGPRTTTACNRCRKKRGRCDGHKPVCGPCSKAGEQCEYELGMDRRKPYAKSVVQAMQLRIDTLEAQLAALTGEAPPRDPTSPHQRPAATFSTSSRSAASTSPDLHEQAKPGLWSHLDGAHSVQASSLTSRPGTADGQSFASSPSTANVNSQDIDMDRFRGGLALNAHGELRYYASDDTAYSAGPTSSYRSVLVPPADYLADGPSSGSHLAGPAATLQALRSYSLTRAPIPTAAPCEPVFPTRPPELDPDFKARLFRLAFEFGLAHYNLVPERQFYQDLQMFPLERTQHCSPFLMHVVLAVGCRYLERGEDYPPEICGLYGDPDTRGDVFVNWARFLLDQEWYNPNMSTIRGLLVLGMYMAGRGFDGPCQIFVGLALKLTEDFGLNLGPHRLGKAPGSPPPGDLFSTRGDCFWSAFASDVISSLYIGRRTTFTPEVLDVKIPPTVSDLDYDEPQYRSSAFSWSSRLVVIACRVLAEVYSPSEHKTAEQRRRLVPALHLELESWNHDLPSFLRANGSAKDPAKAPHPHILALNMAYHSVHIALHRPFYHARSASNDKDKTEDLSTEKCLLAAANIVRLVRLMKGSAGLSRSAPGVQLAAFSAGTVLALAAYPMTRDRSPESPKRDSDRRAQAKKDLSFLISALKEIGLTWTTALTSAGVLEAIMAAYESREEEQYKPLVTAEPQHRQHPSPPLATFMPTPPVVSSAVLSLSGPSYPFPPPVAFQALLNPPALDHSAAMPSAHANLSLLSYGLGLQHGIVNAPSLEPRW